MSEPKKTDKEKLKELDQRINRYKKERQKVMNRMKDEERKQRNHAMILIGSTLMTHFPEHTDKLINSSDEVIVAWVHSLFKRAPETEHNRAAETQQNNTAPETAHNQWQP